MRKNTRPTERWCLLTCFWSALIIVLIATISVLFLMHKPVWVELEILASIVVILMTIFYTFVLYYGVYFSKENTLTLVKPIGNPLDVAEVFR
jgi:energy-coupling factor transporter transmembrane protein EcfT